MTKWGTLVAPLELHGGVFKRRGRVGDRLWRDNDKRTQHVGTVIPGKGKST